MNLFKRLNFITSPIVQAFKRIRKKFEGIKGEKESDDIKCTTLVEPDEVRRFMFDCFVAQNTPPKHAHIMANLLYEADYRGIYSQGMHMLDTHIHHLCTKTSCGTACPRIIKSTAATAWVDGQNALGGVVGNYCMELAIDMARDVGVGWVCAKRSNHFGIAGWYSMMATNQGLVGLTMSNAPPVMVASGGKEAVLGSNPICATLPACGEDCLLLDMATTTASLEKIELHRRLCLPIPSNWALDCCGDSTTDPSIAMKAKRLMPLGGDESTSGYKGFYLGALVDILSGVMAGANFGKKVRHQPDLEFNLGQCFIAVNPRCFYPCFEENMSELFEQLRCSKPIDPLYPVQVAGDPEREHTKKVLAEGGICYDPRQIEACNKLACKLGVTPLKINN